jgi:phage terminase large subunit-like protein
VILTVPVDDDGIRYPTLGPQIVDWMHEHLVFGPGDLRGEPLVLDAELQAFIWKFYELFPKGHPLAGRRRFQRCALSLAKGLRKSELAALIAAAELHPSAPVRFSGWRGRGLAPGCGVTDPFIAMIATTEEQSDELVFGALKAILEESALRDDFDIGLERIMRLDGRGRAVSLAGSPDARDGARVTFQIFDETHRYTLPRLKDAHQTMMANLPKRKLSDAWSLEITTAPEPGAGSVAESTMEYARLIESGKASDATMFFYHREASPEHDVTTAEGARAAVIEASGISAAWRDIDGIMARWSDPTTDRTYWTRVWCNQIVKGASQAFDVTLWKALTADINPVKRGDLITLGFDGAMFHDSTGVVATHVATGFQWVPGLWECPPGRKDWEVPSAEVDALIRQLFDDYDVWRMYADPPYWKPWLAVWSGDRKLGERNGEKRITEWWTNRPKAMARALLNFETSVKTRTISHDGDGRLVRHIGNSRRRDLPGERDEQGRPLWVIQKDRPDSPNKIDLAVASVLSWEARTDAIAAGATKVPLYQCFIYGGGRR